MSIKFFRSIGILVLALVLITGFKYYQNGKADPPAPANTFVGFAVVELFTSEGCSSCPPADAMMADLKSSLHGQPVYFLAFHVDYWNYLGWKDPFSDASFSKRQKTYADGLSADVYTPQMIVNGRSAFVGSNREKADAEITEALQVQPQNEIKFNSDYDQDKSHIKIDFTMSQASKDEVLNIALVQQHASSDVIRGENGGRKLTHINVVRSYKTIPSVTNGSEEILLPESLKGQQASIICYTQNKNTLKVSGAAAQDLAPVINNR